MNCSSVKPGILARYLKIGSKNYEREEEHKLAIVKAGEKEMLTDTRLKAERSEGNTKKEDPENKDEERGAVLRDALDVRVCVALLVKRWE